jgi:hypothetical protein
VLGKTITVSTDRVKPAYILNEADIPTPDRNSAVTPVPPIAAPVVKRTYHGHSLLIPCPWSRPIRYPDAGTPSPNTIVYGEPLRIPGEFLTKTTHTTETVQLITQLRQHMARLRPVPATRHANPGTFVHKELHTCTHVFRRQDAHRLALESPYGGPYRLLPLLVRGKTITVSTDRVKPAYILNEADIPTSDRNPAVTPVHPIAAPATPSTSFSPLPPTRTTRSGRHVHFLARFNH